MTSVVHDYLNFHEEYIKKYGQQTLVIMQVGSFYEAYATNTRGPKLSDIANMLNIICTRKDKSIQEINEKNPYLMGFNMVSAQKFISLLVNNGYTIVTVDQTCMTPKVKREVTNVYSPGTYIENLSSHNANYIVCIYFEEEIQRSSGNLLCTGMSAIDLSTGKNCVYEAHSNNSDQKLALDETVRFINNLNPSEIIIYYQPKKTGTPADKLISYLEIGGKSYQVKTDFDKKYVKPSYQNEFLGKVYKDTGMLSPVEFLGIDRMDYARLSFVLLLEFAYEHNNKIITNIPKPEHYMDNNSLILANNAIHQLNIIESTFYNENVNCKFKSLFDVVNNASTPMGKRYLKDRLISPLVSHIELNNVYNHTDELIKNARYLQIENNLKSIPDIERIIRKMSVSMIHPYELANVIECVNDILEIYDFINQEKILVSIVIPKEIITKFRAFHTLTTKTFNIQSLKLFSLNNITSSFYNPGIHAELDDLKGNMEVGYKFMNDICQTLSEYIDETGKRFTKEKNKEKIFVRKNKNGFYYLSLSKIRASMLKENLINVNEIDINGKKVKVSDLIYDTRNKGVTKITISGVSDQADELADNEDEIAELTKAQFIKDCTAYYKQYYDIFECIIKFISYVDYVKSNAKTAVLYNYTRPKIQYDPKISFIDCKQLRHPVIERIIDYEYVPHDLCLGKDLKGMLLYGINSVGKCFDPYTLIILYSGITEYAKNIKYGDKLLGDDGTPRIVTGITNGKGNMYKIVQSDGNSFTVNGPHILCLKHYISKQIIEISVDDYLSKSNSWKSEYRLYRVTVDFVDLVDFVDNTNFYSYGLNIGNFDIIPANYKTTSRKNRNTLLSGILNSVHSNKVNDNEYIFVFNKHKEFLVNDICFLARSLGFNCQKTLIPTTNTFTIKIYCNLNKTNNICTQNNQDHMMLDFEIVHMGLGEYYGFETSGNRRFLLEDFIVTHNSSLMKATGLGIIMAQAGMFVPAAEFTYSPYKSLYTRITGMDNILRGLSSFAVEMLELKAILKRSGPNTLVIGDEICRGTEHISGNALVASTIINLSKIGSSFMFATHLHEIASMDRITCLDNVKSFHVSIDFDPKTGALIYDRQLKPGPGEPIYGITFARHIINDSSFMELATEIKNELLNNYNELISGKKSRYNSDIYVHECQICGKTDQKMHVSPLETHHIQFQKNCKNDFSIDKPHIHKNSKANLIVLCNECHDSIHSNDLAIDGYIMTSDGKSIVTKKPKTNEKIIVTKKKKLNCEPIVLC